MDSCTKIESNLEKMLEKLRNIEEKVEDIQTEDVHIDVKCDASTGDKVDIFPCMRTNGLNFDSTLVYDTYKDANEDVLIKDSHDMVDLEVLEDGESFEVAATPTNVEFVESLLHDILILDNLQSYSSHIF